MVQRCKLPGEPICQILEEQTGERVGSFGSRGQGPGEFIAAEFIGKTEGDDTLYFVNLPSTVLLYAREEKGADYRYVGSEKIKVNAARKSKVDDNTAKMQSIKWLGV